MRYLPTLICILFILYLFWIDRKKDGPSYALWIPLAWMFFAGSRYVSSWLGLSAPVMTDSNAEGDIVNAVSFFLLIVAGVLVLSRRKIDWGRLLSQNKWIWLYFLYCGISITWSDFPFVSFKRWIKEIGNPIMVLVILTEKRPYEAIGVILRRLAFLWLPLSALFIRYYGELGRGYTAQGKQMFTGVGQQKNDLGLICLISGIYFFWNFLLNRKGSFKLGERGTVVDLILLGLVLWLLHMSNSATSWACLVVAASLFFVGRIKVVAQKPDKIIFWGIVVISFFFFLEATPNVSDFVIRFLGRDQTLTERVPMWELLKGMATNSFVGVGYQSFWLGPRLEKIKGELGVVFNQAHNGYLEQYLNLGYIGVAFIGVVLLSGLLKVRRHLNVDYPSAMLRLSFIVTALLYNYTEASFYGLNNMWLLTLFAIIEISVQHEHGSAHGDGTGS